MTMLSKTILGKRIYASATLLQKPLVAALVIAGSLISFADAHAGNTKVFVQSTQGSSSFAGITTKEDGTLALAANPKNLATFDPVARTFIANFEYPTYSFMDGLALIHRPGFVDGLAGSSFLDGRIPTLFDNGAYIQSNTGEFDPAPGPDPIPGDI